jgi:hypothetical protein
VGRHRQRAVARRLDTAYRRTEAACAVLVAHETAAADRIVRGHPAAPASPETLVLRVDGAMVSRQIALFLSCQKPAMARPKSQVPIVIEQLHLKPGHLELLHKGGTLKQVQLVYFVIAAIQVANAPKGRNLAGQSLCRPVFFGGHQHCPPFSFGIRSQWLRSDTARFSNIKEQNSSRWQGMRDTLEEGQAFVGGIGRVKDIVQALTDGHHSNTRRDGSVKQRADQEGRLRNALAGQGDQIS